MEIDHVRKFAPRPVIVGGVARSEGAAWADGGRSAPALEPPKSAAWAALLESYPHSAHASRARARLDDLKAP